MRTMTKATHDLDPARAARAIKAFEDRAVIVLKTELDRATLDAHTGDRTARDVLHGIAPDMPSLWARAITDSRVAVRWLHAHYADEMADLAVRAAA